MDVITNVPENDLFKHVLFKNQCSYFDHHEQLTREVIYRLYLFKRHAV